MKSSATKTRAIYWPNAGDIIWLDLDPPIGHEQAGRRPCLVLSEHALAVHSGYAIVCPITSRVRGTPFEILLQGTETTGVVLTHQVRSIDLAARFAKFIEIAPLAVLRACRDNVQVLIGQTS